MSKRLVKLIRGGQKNIKAVTVIYNLEHLKNTIKFFTEDTGVLIQEPIQEPKEEKGCNCNLMA